MSFRTIYGLNRSENGWPMVNRDECDIVRLPDLAFMDTAPIRKGYALLCLGAFAYWYDRNVPGEIVSPVWGWSATNDVPSSNHLSGTALDINAPQYPWGGNRMRDTFPDRYRMCRVGVNLWEGNIFWGADWGRKDEMHFQLNNGTCVGMDASPKLKEFCDRNIRGGIYGGSPAPPEYSQSVKDAFAQAALRFGWW